MKRRVMIAKALSHEPRILFLDEPTAGVDVELRKDMWQLVRALRASGVTIILTTHYIEEAEEIADRIGVINNGDLSWSRKGGPDAQAREEAAHPATAGESSVRFRRRLRLSSGAERRWPRVVYTLRRRRPSAPASPALLDDLNAARISSTI